MSFMFKVIKFIAGNDKAALICGFVIYCKITLLLN